MLGNIKERLFSLQDEITSSVKNLTPSQVQTGLFLPKHGQVDLKAGEDLLDHYQDCWEAIHKGHEKNSRKAAKCDMMITKIKQDTDKKWSQIMTIEKLVSEIPTMNSQVQKAMETLANLESLFSDVEVSLLALEDTIDAREMQERELEQRFQLTMYQEKRRARFNQLSEKLQKDYEIKKQQLSDHYQQKFQQDMDSYKNQASSRHLLLPPSRKDPDASLETVDLNEDESGLEKFLQEDLLCDVSPLPKDDEKNLIAPEDGVDVEINISSPSVSESSNNPSLTNKESVYFTPATTTEKLADINLDD